MKAFFHHIAEVIKWLARSLCVPGARRLGGWNPREMKVFFPIFSFFFLVITLKNERVPAIKKRGAPLLG